ncbi:MAG: hypothetical protein K9H58_19570 [Bacteroidales bacterium]|nr:hypothetical protein [Bacteroidales bacterium]
MNKLLAQFLIILFIVFEANAQTGVAINKTGAAPDASALLDVSGTDGGVLIPRITSVQKAAISNPATGLIVYDTDSTRFYYYDGGWNAIANPHQLGDGTNYAEFEDDGTLVFYGSSTTYEDLQIPGYSFLKTANSPTLTNYNSTGLYLYLFDNGSTLEEVQFTVQMPHGWKQGSTIYPHIHYMPADATSGNIHWGLEYTWANVNGTFGTSATITMAAPTSAASNRHLVNGFPGITPIVDVNNKISSIMICRIYRDADHTEDTYNGGVYILQFDIHYEVNTMGSRTEWNK